MILAIHMLLKLGRGGTSLRSSVELPIIVFVSQHLQEQSRRVHKHVTQLVLTSLDHAYRDIRVLCKTCCNHKARRSSAYDDEIVFVGEELLGTAADGRRAVSIDSIGAIGAICVTVHVGCMMCW
jgi:hypothetical protein